MITRRRFLTGLGGLVAGAVGLAGYAFAVEPMWRLVVARYRLALPKWPVEARPLTIAILSDLHAIEPHMPVARIAAIVDRANALQADLILLLGDYEAHHRFRSRLVPAREWSAPLAGLRAPLGVHAILGNHDWWYNTDEIRAAFDRIAIPLLENRAVKIDRDGHRFWLAGTASIVAHRDAGGRIIGGADDLPGTLAQVTDADPVILLAHEPDLFVAVPDRVTVTLSGHTHGGQVYVPFIGRPVTPSGYGQRFAYGHVVEAGRHLIVSGGLGCSIIPVRFGVPPEITLVTLTGRDDRVADGSGLLPFA